VSDVILREGGGLLLSTRSSWKERCEEMSGGRDGDKGERVKRGKAELTFGENQDIQQEQRLL